MSKKAVLAVLMCAVFASLVVTVVHAESNPKPSVPEFTLKLNENPYDVPPITKIDPYTGKILIIQAGYRAQNISIEITIKNQPFAYSFNGTPYHLYYNVRSKGHFGLEWTELYGVFSFPMQSDSDYTTFSHDLFYPLNAQVDFQVQAISGAIVPIFVSDRPPLQVGHFEEGVAIGEVSGWSNTQTITIPEVSPSPVPSPTLTPTPASATPTLSLSPITSLTPSPTQPAIQIQTSIWFYLLIVAMALVIGVLLGVVVMQRKRIRENKPNT